MTNKETLDLALDLGIGVKTHSSSIEDAQADRVRRKAEREGLIRDVQPEEPGKAKKTTKKAAAAAKAEPEAPAEAPAAPTPAAAAPAPASVDDAPARPAAEAPAPVAEPEPVKKAPARLVTSSGTQRPVPTR